MILALKEFLQGSRNTFLNGNRNMRSSSRSLSLHHVDQLFVSEPDLVEVSPSSRSNSHANAVLNSPTRHVNDST